ncbi:unnamed protein product [Prorocentrum cordatum]|uniref:Thioredoxin domain-containing protein n=2 Tax=Prorocentrum cordatum TaxID=2364126 RepID=A0ABN9TQ30_9DINO|nr:unnamed protein product [Polarella glacialis]
MLASTAVRWLPQDFVEASQTGGVFTLLAYFLMLTVVILEVRSYVEPLYTSAYQTLLLLDDDHSSMLQINLDVQLYDIECRHLKVAVFSRGTEERMAQSQDLTLRPVDVNGRITGASTRSTQAASDDDEDVGEAEHKKQMEAVRKEDGKAELDADWSSSHDGFKHQSFDHVIQGHDFTFVNFFAGWCGHCQKFAPTWNNLAKTIQDMEFLDSGKVMRTVRLIKMNCVDFREQCHKLGIDAYPTLRLYKADGSFSVFDGNRKENEMQRWIERTVKTKTYAWGKHHEEFEKGCNVQGKLDVPRMPGHLELTAGGGDQNLNSRMTNVSHLVKHLSFSHPADGRVFRKLWSSFPSDVVKHFNPIDARKFVTTEFHQAWIHDVQVVRTVSTNEKVSFQLSHQKRLTQVKEEDIPQAIDGMGPEKAIEFKANLCILTADGFMQYLKSPSRLRPQPIFPGPCCREFLVATCAPETEVVVSGSAEPEALVTEPLRELLPLPSAYCRRGQDVMKALGESLEAKVGPPAEPRFAAAYAAALACARRQGQQKAIFPVLFAAAARWPSGRW